MKFRSILVLAVSNLYFVFAGLLLIPYAGFQHDEVAFAAPIYQQGEAFYSRHVGHRWIPIMINSYAGAFKTWIWWPIFKVWHPSVYSLRVPALLLAALSIVLFWPIMVRAGGRRAAAVATVLLASDSMYLMTSIFDWGPCVLQHVLLMAVMLAFLRYHETGIPKLLALASFLAGLALWEKALFFWLAGGLGVAGLAIYFKPIRQHVSLRNLGIAAASFLVGAGPFVMYNVHKPNSTLGENATFSTEEFDGKVVNAHRTINGQAIFNYICFDDWVQPARAPQTAIEQASLSLREATGSDQTNYMMWAYGLAILLTPFTWRTRAFRPMLFALIFSLTAWGLMLITKGAGASVHHIILLWPVTLMFLALPMSEASQRLPAKIGMPVLCVVVAFFAAGNILVTNQYLAQFIRNGPTSLWTNAIFPLSDDLLQSHYGEVDGIDWGTDVPLKVLERARIPLAFVDARGAAEPAREKMDKDGFVFLGRVNNHEKDPNNPSAIDFEVYEGVNKNLDTIAEKKGLVKQVIKTFHDGNGRAVFELYQYHPAPKP